MKNYFIIHALGNTANDYWYPWVKKQVEDKGFECITPTLPPLKKMSYSSWEEEFNKYKHKINKETVFVGHSTGSVFLVHYLMKHNLHISKFIGVVSFNENNTNSPKPEWEEINKSFFVSNLENFINFAKTRICFYSPADVYDFKLLDKFATQIKAKKIILEKAGHFTSDYGYGEKFLEVIKYLFN